VSCSAPTTARATVHYTVILYEESIEITNLSNTVERQGEIKFLHSLNMLFHLFVILLLVNFTIGPIWRNGMPCLHLAAISICLRNYSCNHIVLIHAAARRCEINQLLNTNFNIILHTLFYSILTLSLLQS